MAVPSHKRKKPGGGKPSYTKRPPSGKRRQKKLGFFGILALIFRRFYRKAKGALKDVPFLPDLGTLNQYRSILFAIVAVVVVMATGVTIWALTNKNANEIYLGETRLTVAKMNKNLTTAQLTSLVENKLQDLVGMNIRLKEAITYKPIHASKKDMVLDDELLNLISKAITYEVEGTAVYVDGTLIGVLKNSAEVAQVKERLIAPFISEDMEVVSSGFVEDFTEEKLFTDHESLTTADILYERLNQTTETESIYTVQPGDAMQKIAASAGTTVEKLCALNNIPVDQAANIFVGQELVLMLPKPFLSVIVVEKITYPEVVKPETITQNNPSKPKTYKQVIQTGRDGQQEVTAHVTRINNFFESQEAVDAVITLAPVNEIIEVGTG